MWDNMFYFACGVCTGAGAFAIFSTRKLRKIRKHVEDLIRLVDDAKISTKKEYDS